MARPVVLVVIKGLGIGGAERLIAEGARHWDTSSFDYRVAYVLPWKDQLVDELAARDIEVTCIGGRRGLDPSALLRLRKLIARSGASIVHAHLPATGILARIASPVPVVYTEHNIVGSYGTASRIANRLTYGLNRAVIAVSDAVAASLDGYPGPDPVVIDNGVTCVVDDKARDEARAELDLGSHQSLIVHVGNIRPHKGHRTLLAATEILSRTDPGAVVISIGGEKFPGDLEALRLDTARLGLDAHLRFLGRREDARSFLAAADIVVNPSDAEGLPIAVLEAMALSKPVVATAVGGVPSVVLDGVTGTLVPAGDPGRLAAALSTLLKDEATRAEMGHMALSVVNSRYGLDRMVGAVEDLYRTILDG
jgi:glycosyltransferase involved in cell wall biosynthesis